MGKATLRMTGKRKPLPGKAMEKLSKTPIRVVKRQPIGKRKQR